LVEEIGDKFALIKIKVMFSLCFHQFDPKIEIFIT